MKKNCSLIKIKNVSKSYSIKEKSQVKKLEVLSKINIEFNKNKFYLIKGHSGSGKSTLINILGLIDAFDNGTYELYNNDVKKYNDRELSEMRMKNIGFIFQSFNLKSTLKSYENVMLPMLINKNIESTERKNKAIELLKLVGLEDRINHFPSELSGGEEQRVAIARALANDPEIILADEPTGNLDSKTEKEIFTLLRKLADEGKCVIVVSHSDYASDYADEIYNINNGNIIGEVNEK